MKIKCKDCFNELNGKCLVKKTTVKLNKYRKCNDYEFEQSKDIARLERKARALDNQDKAYRARQASLNRANTSQEEAVKHPTTGDLSRFKTTAAWEKNLI